MRILDVEGSKAYEHILPLDVRKRLVFVRFVYCLY